MNLVSMVRTTKDMTYLVNSSHFTELILLESTVGKTGKVALKTKHLADNVFVIH